MLMTDHIQADVKFLVDQFQQAPLWHIMFSYMPLAGP